MYINLFMHLYVGQLLYMEEKGSNKPLREIQQSSIKIVSYMFIYKNHMRKYRDIYIHVLIRRSSLKIVNCFILCVYTHVFVFICVQIYFVYYVVTVISIVHLWSSLWLEGVAGSVPDVKLWYTLKTICLHLHILE